MAPVFDGGAIAGFGDSEDFEAQFGVALEAAARVDADFVMATAATTCPAPDKSSR